MGRSSLIAEGSTNGPRGYGSEDTVEGMQIYDQNGALERTSQWRSSIISRSAGRLDYIARYCVIWENPWAEWMPSETRLLVGLGYDYMMFRHFP